LDLQRCRKVWRGPRRPLASFWKLSLQSDFKKSLTGNYTGGYRGSTRGFQGLFLEVLKVEKAWERVA